MNQTLRFSAFPRHFIVLAALANLSGACASAPSKPRNAPVATPRTAEATTESARTVPGPSADEIRAAVTGRDEELRQCYLVGTFKNAQLAGTVNVTFTIDTQGRVSETSDSGSDFADPEVITCVLDVFAGMEFPPGASSETEVTYPVNFGDHG